MFSLGQQVKVNQPEVNLRYMGAPFLWKLQPVLGASVASNGAVYLGAGSAVRWRATDSGLFARVSVLARGYRHGKGRKLGGPLKFRSALDIGVQGARGMSYGLGIDHRSNAGIYKANPGLDTVYLFVSVLK